MTAENIPRPSRAMIATWVITTAALTGCAQFRSAYDEAHSHEAAEQVSRVDNHSSFPALSRTNFEQVNLVEMIDPEGYAKREYASLWSSEEKNSAPDTIWS